MDNVFSRFFSNRYGLQKPKILIIGMHKSGTTAIAELLGLAVGENVSSDPLHEIDKVRTNGRIDLVEKRVTLDFYLKRYPRLFTPTIIKDPHFSLMIRDLLEVFPESQLVSIIRDPRDTIRSILNRLNLKGDTCHYSNLVDQRLPYGWQMLLEGKSPDIPGHDFIEVLAMRWNLIARQIKEHQDNSLLIKYEDFNDDKENVIRECATNLGYHDLKDFSSCLDRQFQPKGNNRVRLTEFFPEHELNKIERICCEMMEYYGYEA